jgi:hypothetical protein
VTFVPLGEEALAPSRTMRPRYLLRVERLAITQAPQDEFGFSPSLTGVALL